ncbi:hypothetical protein J437_LFUL008682 [Ladona fulva]|uniref:Uncharacterized protein n=1 Tax=Ladona fulva TaxID=123851 RepID=A0A8K0P117_LADFU|nr:hypothetical protein J437_LFUL008682 [Ladona fulva]
MHWTPVDRLKQWKFNIHRNTLWLKTKQARGLVNRPAQKVGCQPVFTEEEEKRLIAHAIAMSSFGFPMTKFDLRCVVKAYLNRTGRKFSAFKEGNFPGKEWAISFMKHHKDILSECVSKNINYARASMNEEVIDMFFGHLEKELDGIRAKKILNYDETNVQDDPGSKKVSGFQKTRIFPLDKTQVLQQLPKSVIEESLESMTDVVGDVFLGELNKKREEVTEKRTTNRRKKLNVSAGKSISIADVEEARSMGNLTAAKKASE